MLKRNKTIESVAEMSDSSLMAVFFFLVFVLFLGNCIISEKTPKKADGNALMRPLLPVCSAKAVANCVRKNADWLFPDRVTPALNQDLGVTRGTGANPLFTSN